MMDIPTTLPGGPLGTVTGLLLIIIGIIALLFPGLAFVLIVMFLAIFAVIVSIELIRTGIASPEDTNTYRALQVIIGIIGVMLGFLVLVLPYFFSIAAKDLFGVWAILSGVANILSVFGSSSGLERGLNALSGLVLALVGVLLLLAPAIITDYLLVVILGLFAIIIGIFSIWIERSNSADTKTINHSYYR
jgi:uncharacterized membrane protein HdeD (DUF308 family)